MDLGDLAKWCLDNCVVPDDLDEPFIVDYNIFFPDDDPEDRRGDYEVDKKTDKADVFRFFATTKRLLIFSSNANLLLHTDATYSVNWNVFPLLINGTSDLNRTFHPLGLALSSKEAHFDYKFLFNSLVLGRTQVGEGPLDKLCLTQLQR